MSRLPGPPVRILLGLALGLALGMGAAATERLEGLPALVAPVGVLWVNAIRMTVTPLVMALLVTAITGPGGARAARLGGRAVGLFASLAFASAGAALLLAPPLIALLPLDAGAGERLAAPDGGAADGVPPFRDWLTGLMPVNPFAAAAAGEMLPLLVFTALFAAALRAAGGRAAAVTDFFAGVRDAMLTLIGWIMRLAPFGVFALAAPLAAGLGLDAAPALGGFVLIACGIVVLLAAALYPLARFGAGIGVARFARAVAPAQLVGFGTRSSVASLPATLAAADALGVSARTSSLVLPAAAALFKFASPAARISGTVFVAALYGIEPGFPALALMAGAIALLSFYSPGIPSGGLLVMAPVYESLGLPVAGIGILIAVDLVVDMFITAANVTANAAAAVLLDGPREAPEAAPEGT